MVGHKISRSVVVLILALVGINLFLYLFISIYHNTITLNRSYYYNDAYHYMQDTRIGNNHFHLLNALAQYDAQWYIRIAENGYPNLRALPKNIRNIAPGPIANDNATYAFFPGFPLVIALFNLILHNVTLAAFVVTQILFLLNVVSLYYVISRAFTKLIAIKSIFLIFLFPFSIFFYSYYTESIQLLLLVWFSFFLYRKRWVASAIMLGLLAIVKGNLLLLVVIFPIYLYKTQVIRRISLKSFIVVAITLTPLLLWCLYCYWHTGNPFYFYAVQAQWRPVHNIFLVPIYNVLSVLAFPAQHFHQFHSSMIDNGMVVIIAFLLFKSYKLLPRWLWLISFVIWVTPILTKDLMSYTRLQIISFPLFIYLATRLTGWKYYLTISIFAVLLLAVSVLFVNWYWIG